MDQFVQLSGIGLGGLALWILYQILTNDLKHTARAIEDNTKILTKLNEAIKLLCDYLKK